MMNHFIFDIVVADKYPNIGFSGFKTGKLGNFDGYQSPGFKIWCELYKSLTVYVSYPVTVMASSQL